MEINKILKDLSNSYLLRKGQETNYFDSTGCRLKEGDIVEIYNDPRLGTNVRLGEFILENKLVVVFYPSIGDHILSTRIKRPYVLH